MEQRQVIQELQRGDINDNVSVVSDDGIFEIQAVTVADGTIILSVEKVVEFDGKTTSSSQRNNQSPPMIGGGSNNNSGGFDISQAIDIFGDLAGINTGD